MAKRLRYKETNPAWAVKELAKQKFASATTKLPVCRQVVRGTLWRFQIMWDINMVGGMWDGHLLWVERPA
jgi:hypothetical protein